MRPMRLPLLLSGFMATGKSAVGRLLAEKSGAHFVDLDTEIVARRNKSIAEIFASEGESEFRSLERKVLEEEMSRAQKRKTVMSLGGGALLDPDFRIDTLHRSIVVTLEASPSEILRRVADQDGDSGSRPLLAGPDPQATVSKLLQERAVCYAEAHGRVQTDGRQPEDIARTVEQIWNQNPVAVASGMGTYNVLIGSNLIAAHLPHLLGETSGVLLVTDTNVDPLHGDKARAGLAALDVKNATTVLTPGEEHKDLQSLSAIYQTAFDAGMDRSSTFVGLGGGVTTDMTGFAAATWVRGVRWVGLPTTLLAMVDASVGGKTAVDFHTAKNSVGAFWQPAGVICDIETLQTETDRQYIGALSEVVKTALIGDAELFELLEKNAGAILERQPEVIQEIVERCVRVKARVVALDARESGVRATLNLGHTIGHALESSGGYSDLTHGEAVSLGLVAALRLGELKGHTKPELTHRVLRLLKSLRMPHRLSRDDLEKCTALLGHDKKRSGASIRFVYAGDVGRVFTESIEISDLIQNTPALADTNTKT